MISRILTTTISQKMAINTLSAMIMAVWCTSSYAANEQTEVEALRQELSELKQIVQALTAQQNSQAFNNTSLDNQAKSNQPLTTQPTQPTLAIAKQTDGWMALPDGKSTAKVYGFIRADMLHDFKGQPSGKFSNLHTQPLDSTDPVNNKTAFTAAVTRVGVDFKTPTAIGDVGGKIEGDFWGNGGTGSATFRIRHAYLTTGNWLFGQTWSPFAGQEYAAETVDFNGVVGTSIRRVAQIRYTHALNPATALTIAAEENSNSDARLPAIVTRLEHKLDDNRGAVALRAMLHEKRGIATSTVNGQVNNTEKDKTGYGAAIGAWYQLNSADKLTGQLFHVKGDGNFNYGTGSGYSVNTTTGELYFDEYNSAQLGLTHTFNPKIRSTLALSWVDFKDNSQFAQANPTANQTLTQASINLFYLPVPSVALGSEYTYGQREVFNGDEGKQSHLNLMARYSF